MMQAQQVLQDRYQLQQPLGRNLARQTWLALDLAAPDPTPVVVKLLAFHPQLAWDDWKLFEREVQVLQHLQHAHIPQYRDHFTWEGEPGCCWFGLVQDYIPGASLQQWLDRGQRFTEAEMRQIAIAVLEILRDLHSLNPPLLHRDIKPSNLIWTSEQSIYLVDFGAVQNQAIATGGSFTVVGTYGYTPIEQFGGRAVPASDLYALGATLVHLATGVAPADLPQEDLRWQWHVHAGKLSPYFQQWLDRLTEPALERRFQSAEQALAALTTPSVNHITDLAVPTIPESSIQLYQSPDLLEIVIPRSPLPLATILKSGGQVCFSLGLVSLPLWLSAIALAPLTPLTEFKAAMLPVLASTPFLLFFHAFLMSGLGVFSHLGPNALQISQGFRGPHRLQLTPDCFAIESTFLGINQRWQHDSTQKIAQVQPTSLGGIRIETQTQSYTFGVGLATEEQTWLIHSIGTWLQQQASRSP